MDVLPMIWLLLVGTTLYTAVALRRWMKARKDGDQQVRRTRFIAMRNGMFATLIALVAVPNAYIKASKELSAKAPTQRPNPCDNAARAYTTAQDHVRKRLRSPASANFPFLDFTAKKSGTCRMTIRSYVDAQNGFGATIRTNFTAVMERRSGRWKLVSLRMK